MPWARPRKGRFNNMILSTLEKTLVLLFQIYKLLNTTMATTDMQHAFVRAEEEKTVEDHGLLKNTVDNDVVVNVIPVEQNLPRVMTDINAIVPEQSLRDFLARPTLVTSGIISSSSPAGAQIANGDLYAPLAGNPLFMEKLNGFGGVRSRTHLTLQVNGQKFQQGLLILFYIPCYFENKIREDNRLLDLMTMTQLPRVELDVSCDTQVTLQVPYVHPKLFYDYSTGSPGTWFIYVYSPINSATGSLNVSYTVWVSYHDVELFAPTVRRPILQMGPEDSGGTSASQIMKSVSGTLSEIAKVPVLSSVASPAAWATGVASKTLASFGWSKPMDSRPVVQIQRQNAANILNADGQTAVVPTGMFQTNQVEIMPGFGRSDIDEMSISYITQRSAFWSAVTWADTAASDTSLFSFRVDPRLYYRTSGAFTCMTPVNALARHFLYWRGGLRFRFKVVKTEMHSGRLQVSFAPGAASNAGMTLNGAAYLMRNIIDLRDGSEFEVIVPFIWAKYWMQSNGHTGTVDLRVVNPLRAPATCAQSVQIIVEVSGAEDFEVAVPLGNRDCIPFMPGSLGRMLTDNGGHEEIEIAEMSIAEDENVRYEKPKPILQAGGDGPCNLYQGGLGGSRIQPSDVASRYAIGEEIKSLKQIVSKVSWLEGLLNTRFLRFAPFAWGGGNTISLKSAIADEMSFWASMYAFSRGSVDVHIVPSGTGLIQYASQPIFSGFPLTSSNVAQDLYPFSNRDSYETTEHKRVIQMRVPQYFSMHSRLNYLYATGELGAPREYESTANVFFASEDTQTRLYFGRSAGDDFQLGFFLGVYPICSA